MWTNESAKILLNGVNLVIKQLYVEVEIFEYGKPAHSYILLLFIFVLRIYFFPFSHNFITHYFDLLKIN